MATNSSFDPVAKGTLELPKVGVADSDFEFLLLVESKVGIAVESISHIVSSEEIGKYC
jgi:hypothetical protein